VVPYTQQRGCRCPARSSRPHHRQPDDPVRLVVGVDPPGPGDV